LIPVGSTKFRERGYDVVVACNLAKVDVPVRFRLPAPNNMISNIGIVSPLNESSINSGLNMIKCFKHFNPNNTICVTTNGKIKDINQLHQLNCNIHINEFDIGYPGGSNIDVPFEYLKRMFISSLLLKEDYFLHVEPDVLVTGELKNLNDDVYELGMPWSEKYFQPPWLFNAFIPQMSSRELVNECVTFYVEYLKKHNKNLIFDRIVGAGGWIINKQLSYKFLNNLDTLLYHSRELYSGFLEISKKGRSADIKIIYDVLFGFLYPFITDSTSYSEKVKYLEHLNGRVHHPFKAFY
jgi:hypothetical protein